MLILMIYNILQIKRAAQESRHIDICPKFIQDAKKVAGEQALEDQVLSVFKGDQE